MRKFFLSLLLSLGIANAGLLDAIALTVNDDAITLYDIELRAAQMKSDKNKAVGSLIDEILYKQEIKKYKINISMFDVNDYLKNVAAQNGMDLYQFKAIVRQQYPNFELFEEETRRRIEHERLVRELVRNNVKIATKEDLEIFYNNNKEQFVVASSFEITQYSSKSRTSLEKIAQNPMQVFPDVTVQNITLSQNDLNPQMKYLLNNTKVGSFTPVFTANKQFVMQLINKKEGQEIESFEASQERIFGMVMKQREDAFLREHFEKLKLTAQIRVIR